MRAAEPAMLARDRWVDVVRDTPLVSVDLVVRDGAGRVLLGWRNNQPARDCWFVPGGVVRKDESLDAAFARIAAAELGLELRRRDAHLLGVYEHHYPDNFAGVDGVSTHYVVLAHALQVDTFPQRPADDQHRSLQAWSIPASLADPAVHPYTKAYFSGAPA